MPKNNVTDWDVNPANNTDVGGVNISEFCPPSSVNDAERTIMAQIAAWIISAGGPFLKSGGTLSGPIAAAGFAITDASNASTIRDGAGTQRPVGYRGIPLTAKTASYQIALTDVGQGSPNTTSGWTVPLNATTAFALGDTILLYNNSASSLTVTAAGGVTLRLAGTATTGNRTIAQRGLGTLIKVGTDEWVLSGMGVT